jgi:DNA-binding transcriptional regulator YiaG
MLPAMANRIQLLREAAGLKPVDVASRIGVTERTAYRWELDQVQIPDTRKHELAALFHVSVAYLMGWENENSHDHPQAVA